MLTNEQRGGMTHSPSVSTLVWMDKIAQTQQVCQQFAFSRPRVMLTRFAIILFVVILHYRHIVEDCEFVWFSSCLYCSSPLSSIDTHHSRLQVCQLPPVPWRDLVDKPVQICRFTQLRMWMPPRLQHLPMQQSRVVLPMVCD